MSQRKHPHPGDEAIDDAAALWFARHDAGLSPAEEVEFEAWLAADARHVSVWQEYADAFAPLEGLGTRPEASAAGVRANRRRGFSWKVIVGGGAGMATAALIAIGFFTPTTSPEVALMEAPASVVITPAEQILADGTKVELNHGAEIDVEYSTTLREVRLVQGDAHFTVMKDASRPFIVRRGNVEVRAVGTAFAVQGASSAIDVIVTEGRVSVGRLGGLDEPIVTGAGSRITMALDAGAPRLETVAQAEIERQLAWRGPRVELSGTLLREAVLQFNQHGTVQLRVADESVATMRMSGTFRLDKAEAFARLLAENYQLRLERNGDEIVLHSGR